jgi:hypothetical protein
MPFWYKHNVWTNETPQKINYIPNEDILETKSVGIGVDVIVAVAISEETRNYIIENERLLKSSNGRSSKQVELYDYILQAQCDSEIYRKSLRTD